MAQDHGLCRKKKVKKSQTMHRPPLQARVVAANRAVRTTSHDDPGAHGLNRGQSKMNRTGQTVEKGSGHGMAKASRHTACRTNHCRRTQPADSPPGTGLKETTASSWPASRRAVQVSGGTTVVLATQEAGSDRPTCLPPTYRLCLSLSLPTPLI